MEGAPTEVGMGNVLDLQSLTNEFEFAALGRQVGRFLSQHPHVGVTPINSASPDLERHLARQNREPCQPTEANGRARAGQDSQLERPRGATDEVTEAFESPPAVRPVSSLRVTVEDLDSGTNLLLDFDPGAKVSDVIAAAKAQGRPEIVDLISGGRLLKQDRALADIRQPRQFYACVRKGGDGAEPPLAVRPVSQDDLEEMTMAFEGQLLEQIPPDTLQELRKLMTPGLDDLTLVYFYRAIGGDMDKAKTIASNIKDDLK
jgi:hypothetical protein